jgi:septal ring factor EnvC (AmiA/AmiB activator)
MLPVSGTISGRFGAADGNGGTLQGDIVTTQSGAIVTSPVDATVVYAGPYRSYGQLLILDAGDGYHVVLSGLGRLNVVMGQPVLAGEPVGAMGETRVASIAPLGNADGAPLLFVEFRHDKKPVDPSPWWAASSSGRTRNDS